MGIWILLAVLVVAALWIAGTYNSFIGLRTHADEAWSDMDVQMKRRYDLIPNIVNTVKGYATHEAKTLEAVIAARNAAMNAKTPAEQMQAENALSGTLKSLFAVAEAYPDLKAQPNFLALQQELTATEEKIQNSRRFYNANVRDLNKKVEMFPDMLVARMFNFTKREFFEITEEAQRQAPTVQF